MTITDEMLSAYIDNELAPNEMNRVRNALAQDKVLAARLRRLEESDALIAAAYSAIDNEPMPEGVMALLEGAAPKPPAADHTVIAFPGRRPRAPRHWAAPLAASVALAIGVVVGMQVGSGTTQPGVMLAGDVHSKSALHDVLMRTPSGKTAKLAQTNVTVTPILSFEAKDGRFCREFSVDGASEGRRALACMRDGHWRVEIAVASAQLDKGGYVTATSGLAAQFDSVIEEVMASDAFDESVERQLIEIGWKRGR